MDYKIHLLVLNEKIISINGRKKSLESLASRFSPPELLEIQKAIECLNVAILYVEAEIKRTKMLAEMENN